MTACSALGMELNTKVVQRKMAASRGCMALHGTPWTQAFFETVRQLSEEAQERYCVFKSVELLYLLCTEAEEADELLRYRLPSIPQPVGNQGIHPGTPV